MPPRFSLYLRIDEYFRVSKLRVDTFDFIDQRRVREIFDQFGPGLRAIFMYIDKFNIKGFEAVARKVDP